MNVKIQNNTIKYIGSIKYNKIPTNTRQYIIDQMNL